MYLNLWAPTAGLLRAVVCLPDKIWKCLWSQEATGTAWIGLEQNIIDNAVNEWRKRLLAGVRIVGKHFKQFNYRQLKNGQLNEMSTVCQKCEHNVFLSVMLVK